MREYRVWCKTCAVEFLLKERSRVGEPQGVSIACPKCGARNRYEHREIKVAEHGWPESGAWRVPS